MKLKLASLVLLLFVTGCLMKPRSYDENTMRADLQSRLNFYCQNLVNSNVTGVMDVISRSDMAYFGENLDTMNNMLSSGIRTSFCEFNNLQVLHYGQGLNSAITESSLNLLLSGSLSDPHDIFSLSESGNTQARFAWVREDGVWRISSENPQIPDEPAPAASCSDGILNQGEEGVDCGGPCASCTQEQQKEETQTSDSALVSMISDFGLKIDGQLLATNLETIYSYRYPDCRADLEIDSDYCIEHTSEGGGYVNLTWCEPGRRYKLSAVCPLLSISNVKANILSHKTSINPHIPMYSPGQLKAVTVQIDETYNWGSVRFVYTNHGKYPPLKGTFEIRGKRFFCANDACNQAYVIIDHPGKYVLFTTESSQRTSEKIAEFIEDNGPRLYELSFEPIALMSKGYAVNRAVKVCYHPYGIVTGEKMKITWPLDTLVTDRDFTRVYAPFPFYYDSSIWDSPDVIGTMLYNLIGEFKSAKQLGPGEYQVCTSDSMLNCMEACSTSGGLAIGSCPVAGKIILKDELPRITDLFSSLYTFTSYKDLLCFNLFDNLGEEMITGTETTGRGMAFLTLNNDKYPLYVMVFNGEIGVDLLESILDRKYSQDPAEVVRMSTQGDCIEYRYGNGYATVCNKAFYSVVAFSNCQIRDQCKYLVDDLMDELDKI